MIIAFSENLKINLPPLITSSRTTILKTLLEAYTFLVFLLATFLMTRDYLKTKNSTTLLFSIALFIFMVTRASYIKIEHFFDIYHWMGHYLKALASLFLLAAMWRTLLAAISTRIVKPVS